MSKRDRIIRTGNDPVLKSVCAAVRPGEDLATVMENMERACKRNNGVGLAAPQIGILKRAIFINCRDAKGTVRGQFLINPVITFASDERSVGEEGCLSYPGVWKQIARSDTIHVNYLDSKRVPRTIHHALLPGGGGHAEQAADPRAGGTGAGEGGSMTSRKTLTKDDANKVPAGPELDDWVSRAIGHDTNESIPPVSTDLTWAIRAIERADVVAWKISKNRDAASYKAYCCQMSATEFFDDPAHIVAHAVAPTAALAICRAILVATIKDGTP